MNKLQLALGLVGAVVALALAAIGGLADPLGPLSDNQDAYGRPLVTVKIGGDTYTAPVYEDVIMSQRRRQFDREHVGKVMRKMRELVELMVVKKKSHFMVAKTAFSIVPLAMSSSKELRKMQKTDDSPRLARQYGPKMSGLLNQIVGLKSDVRISDDNEVRRRTDGLLEAVEELAGTSPSGLYLDWTEMRINGELLTEYVSPIIRWFRDNGYGMEVRILEGLAAVIKKMGSKA